MAGAAAPASRTTTDATIIYPVTVTTLKDRDFGWLSVTIAGTAVLDPNADTMRRAGRVTAIGDNRPCPEFVGASKDSAVVNIKLQTQPVTLTRVGGTETMTIPRLTVQGQGRGALAQADSFTFRVSGTLKVAAGQVDGTYVGPFDVWSSIRD